MYTLAVCPHDTAENLSKWKRYAQKLSYYLKGDVVVKSFRSFKEEEELLGKELPDMYYARPKIALLLRQKGYIPVAKLKGKRDGFIILKRKGKVLRKPLMVSTIDSPFPLIALIKHFGSLTDLNVIYRDSFEEVLEELSGNRVDIGVVYKEYWEKVKEKYGEFVEEEDEVLYPNLHLLMVKEELVEKLKTITEIIPNFVPATEEDIAFVEDFEKVTAYFLVFRSANDIAQAVLNAPSIGILIYRDRIIYSNKALREITGYSEEELRNMSPLQLIDDSEDKELIKSIIEKRLRGEQFSRVYNELKLRRKDGKVIYTLTFSRTILFNGEYAGFVIVLDITKRKRIEQLYQLIKEVNQLIIKSSSEEELFQNLCQLLRGMLHLPLVWIGFPRKGRIRPVAKCGNDYNYLRDLKIHLNSREAGGIYPAVQAVKTGKIVINPDTRNNPQVALWRESMLMRGYLSSCAIPIMRKGKVFAVINLYANEPNFFNEEVRDILRELQEDVSFALDKIVNLRKLTVINKALELAEEWVAVFDELGIIRFTNEAVRDLLGYEPEEVVGWELESFKSPYITSQRVEEVFDRLRRGYRVNITLPLRKKGGEYVYLNAKMIPVRLPNERVVFVMVAKDITLELELTEEIEKVKFYDILTGLYNFNGFSFKVQEIISEYKGLGALILIDIHNLSYINTHYGLYIGDEILKETARRLRNNFRSYDVIAKLGGDEFGIFTWKIESDKDVLLLERKLERIFSEPMHVGNVEVPVNINAGIVIYPNDGRDFKTLYEKATGALKRAKAEGPGVVRFYNEEMERIAEKHVKVDILIEKAVKKKLFVFYYQPYFSLKDMKLVGFEALVRIIDEEGRVHPPSEFIEYLEKSPYIRDFQYWALDEVIEKSNRWKVPIAFNLYPKSLGDKEFIHALIERCFKDGASITLEITERAIVENKENVRNIFSFLKKSCYGLNIAIDDFGTGYSAFSYLKELPIDYLKIDISFIRDITKGYRDKALVNSMVQMAHSLDMKTIAEGVETEEQLEILKEIECDLAQGYYFSKPLPAEEIEKKLKDWLK